MRGRLRAWSAVWTSGGLVGLLAACSSASSTDLTPGESVPCGSDERVVQGGCAPCPPGTENAAGDDALGPDTRCDPTSCGPDQFVLSNTCRDCPEGTANEAGDDASGADTMCTEDPCTTALGVSCERFAEAYLKASNTEDGAAFGGRVAVDGDTLAVGAADEDSAATGIDGDQSNNGALGSGAVYVFRRSGTTWRQEAYLKASNTSSGEVYFFGWSAAVDGNTLAVGAPPENGSATGVDGNPWRSGAVYVFRRSGTTWRQEAYLKASNAGADDVFGWSVALQGDTLAVGAYNEDSEATGIDGDQSNNGAEGSGAVYLRRIRP